MENTEKYTYTVDYGPEEPEKEKRSLTPSESVFFDELKNNLKKYAADTTAPNPLESLCENFGRLHRLFVTFGRPCLAHSTLIQKAGAWYLAYGRPTKEEADALTETLSGFTVSVHYLAEWNALINRMKNFFLTEQKELRRLFNYEQKIARERKERTERLKAEGPAYCLNIGGGEIYGVLYPQIEELYRVMGRFIEREKAPFQCNVKGYDQYEISISKNVDLHANRDNYFFTDYYLSTFEGQLQCMPAEQLQRVADTIQEFLRVFGENGEKRVRWDIADYPVESQPDITFTIREDGRVPLFRTVPWISKSIHRDEGEETEIAYYIDVNEIHSPELSFGEFVAVYRKLGDFLSSHPESAAPPCG